MREAEGALSVLAAIFSQPGYLQQDFAGRLVPEVIDRSPINRVLAFRRAASWVGGAEKAERPGAVLARRHQQQLTVLVISIGLQEVPDAAD